ncbi:glycosyltransferase family 2 protein [Arenicella sp. 4NH20-0111]|uniref:glycosyltransferase family 2 protein n=1 Tax=Arenicella sp. 4NH20-0111 TaxID=3127648 RepID=UPI003105893F
MKLSIVTTLFRSEEYVYEFYERSSVVAKEVVGDNYEIIFVNDGSPDASLEKALELHYKYPNVKVIDLSRNFGHHEAMMTGLAHAVGEEVFLIDSDLEEEPEWLVEFFNRKSKANLDVVYGVQKDRRDSGLSKIAGAIFYRIFRLLTEVDQPDNIVTARLMSRRYVEALLLNSERELNIGGLWISTGFDQEALEVVKLATSETTYSFSGKLGHLVNAITSFSSKPLYYTIYLGLTISLCSMLFVAWLIINYLFLSRPIDGFTTVVVSIWLLGGIIIALMGVQGIYIAKIFSEVKMRPRTIIKKKYVSKAE